MKKRLPRANIAYFIEAALDMRDVDRLGIKYMLDLGIKVDVVIVTAVSKPHVPRLPSITLNHSMFSMVEISSKADLESIQRTLSKVDLIISFVGTSHKTPENLPILRFISRLNRPTVIQLSNIYPGWNRYRGDSGKKWDRFMDIMGRRSSINLMNSLFARIPNYLAGVRPADFVIVGGTACEQGVVSQHLITKSTRVIYAHAMDYDIYLSNLGSLSKGGNLAVFIDEYLPYHIDTTELGQPMAPEPYFERLRRLFDRIEDTFKCQIVIAACPRAEYEDKPGIFGAREIAYNSTAKLIAQSQLVIAHRSTAINYAVLFRKPILLTATREAYHHSSQRPYFDGFAEALAKEIQFFDEPNESDLSDLLTVNKTVYDRYIDSYIKQKVSPEKPYWQIVIDSVNKSGLARI